MKKKSIFIISLVVILFSIFLTQNSVVYAGDVEGLSANDNITYTPPEEPAEKPEGWTDVFSDARNFINKGSNGQKDFDIANFKINIDTIYNILLTIGIVLTVVIGGVLGIKFMAASAEDKAKIKESMIPYVVGCIVIYGAFFIWKLAIMVVGDL